MNVVMGQQYFCCVVCLYLCWTMWAVRLPDHHGDGLLGQHVAGLQVLYWHGCYHLPHQAVCEAVHDVVDIWTSKCWDLPLTKDFLIGLFWITFRLAMADVKGLPTFGWCAVPPIIKSDQALQKSDLNQTSAVKFKTKFGLFGSKKSKFGPKSENSDLVGATGCVNN